MVRLWEVMEAFGIFGIPHKLMQLCRACLKGTKSGGKIEGEYSPILSINRGLKQGDVDSNI